jgi:N-acyl-D-amino-acid deacylase
MLDAISETIEIGEQTGATVVWSHAKAMGAHFWGSSQAAIRLIQRARSRGVDVWTDQYPYNSTGGDGATVLIPAWALGDNAFSGARGRQRGQRDYSAALRTAMGDAAKAEKVRRDIRHEIARRGGPENVVVMEHPDKSFVGKSVDQLAKARNISPVQMALELQYEGYKDRPGGARLRGFSVWETDMDAFMTQPWTATSTDAGIALPEDGPDVHARFYGSYPRKIRHFALDRGVISVENAIRSSTSLPAQILRLPDRGLLRAGFVADLAVLDLENLRDKATFFEPHQYAEGVDYVLVNGKLVVDGGKPTGELPGAVLRRPAVR